MRLGETGLRAGVVIVAGLVLGNAKSASVAPSAQAGAAISGQCAACHGNNGMSVSTTIPNLAGQHYEYLLSELEAYKNGTRKNPIMNEMARPLSLQQMQDLSAYFASVSIYVGPSKASQ